MLNKTRSSTDAGSTNSLGFVMPLKNEAPRRRLVIVGNGMVAGRFVDELLARNGDVFDLTVIGAEPEGSYNRIMLSSVLAKSAVAQSLIQKDAEWYAARNIRFVAGATVSAIQRDTKTLHTVCGQQFSYDELVLATGSRAATIPAANSELENIFLFRTLADTDKIMSVARSAGSVLIVGGGLLGLEAAYGLAQFGIKVHLVHRSRWLLNRQLDQNAAAMLQSVMTAMGVDFYLGDEVACFHGDQKLNAATLKSGIELPADMAVIATGIVPNAELGHSAGLDVGRAVRVDDYMRTSDAAISAIGECIEHDGCTFGLVDPLWRQAQTLAERLVNKQLVAFKNAEIATKLKVSGVQVFSAGEVEDRPGLRRICICDPGAKVYRKLLLENGRIRGIVLFGDVSSGNHYFELMQSGDPIPDVPERFIFGQAYCSNADKADAAA